MSDPALLGLPTHFEFEGTFYPITNPRPFDVEAAFVIWVQQEAYRSLLPHEKILGPARFAAQVEGWRRDCYSVIKWGKPVVSEALWSDEGVKEMAFLQFAHAETAMRKEGKKPDRPMARETIERIMKDEAKGKELTRLILGIVEEPDPLAPSPEPSGTSPSPTPSEPSP